MTDSPEQGSGEPPEQEAPKSAAQKKASGNATPKKAAPKKATPRKATKKKAGGKKAGRKKAATKGPARKRAPSKASSSKAPVREAREPVSGPGSVTIVVVNWNGRDLLEACLGSALEQDYAHPFDIVVVDNLSKDDSVAFVRKQFPEVRVLVNHENNYAGANNLGAASSNSEFIVCLNTDARVPKDWLRQLVGCAQSDPKIGGVTPLVLFEDGRVNSAGIEALEGFHWADAGLGHTDPKAFVTGPVEGVSGCSALYRRTCWEEQGGLDTDFHMYYEDVDMSLRCRAAGWRLMLCAESKVHHAYNASINKRDAEEGDGVRALKDDLGERNRLFVIARHFPEVLGEILPTSRFVLYSEPAELVDGLTKVLAKWERAELGDLAREQLMAMLLAGRETVLSREAWARSSKLEVGRSREAVRAARHNRETQALRHGAELERARGHVRTLQVRLEAKENDLRAMVARGKELNRQLQESQKRSMAQIQRERDVIARLKQQIQQLQEQANHNALKGG